MRIDSIEVVHVAMPLIYPWRTAYGEDATVQSVLVRMESQGLAAWSEAAPLAAPQYLPEWAGGVFACIRDWLAPILVGEEIDSGEELQARLSFVKGNSFAKGGLDSAWWVLEAMRRETPLYRLLGGRRSQVDVGADFGIMDSVDDLLEAIGRGVEAGFKRTKLKYGPGWDLPVLKEVRKNFPDHTFHIDCNSGYRLSDLEMFREIDQLGLAMIEQPLQYDDLADHARLQKELRTPVCLDESVTSPDKARKAIEMGSCQIVNIKTCRVGGLTPALEIHDRCRQAGIPCWIGSMLESAVGARVNLALATLENFTYPADLFPTSRFYRKDLARPEVFLDQGPSGEPVMSLSEEPGHGTEPDPAMLEECTVARATISA